MKKIIKHGLICVLAVVLLCSALCLYSFAEQADQESAGTQTKNTAFDQEEAEVGFFETIYREAVENCDEIFSLFVFVGTIIIAFIYKKGLLPSLKNVASAISDALNRLGEESQSSSETVKEHGERLSIYSKAFDSLSEKVERLAKELEKNNSDSQKKFFCSLLSTQIELLRDIFLSSSLPHYQKEAVEAKVKEMKEALLLNEEELI